MAIYQLNRYPPLSVLYWPILMHFKFFMPTKRKFDYNNLSQGVQDVMVQRGILPDDDYAHIIPVFHGDMAGVYIDKERPRVEVVFTEK